MTNLTKEGKCGNCGCETFTMCEGTIWKATPDPETQKIELTSEEPTGFEGLICDECGEENATEWEEVW
jgi:hypothetical protein